MISAIFFDLDGTIRHSDPRGSDVFAEQAARLGVRIRDDDRLRAMRWEHYYWANSPELLGDMRRYGRMSDDFWKRYSVRQLVALGASSANSLKLAEAMHAYMSEAYQPSAVVPADLSGVLDGLKESGLRLAVISNRDKPYDDEVTELGLAHHFAFCLSSGEISVWKPDPEIFFHACRRLDVPPGDAAYVGDNYFADVVGARAAGLLPVLYDPRGIFDDPECAVIRSFEELPHALGIEASLPKSRP